MTITNHNENNTLTEQADGTYNINLSGVAATIVPYVAPPPVDPLPVDPTPVEPPVPVKPPTDAPTAAFSVQMKAGRVVVATDASTHMPDGTTYQLSWGQDMPNVGIRAGSNASYRYREAGDYIVAEKATTPDGTVYESQKGITVVDDGTAPPPVDITPDPTQPTQPPTPTPPPVATNPPPTSNAGSGPHVVIASVTDGAGKVWSAQTNVGDDPTVAAIYMSLTDAEGSAHPGLTAWFYADCVDMGATRFDNAYDYINCNAVTVTYDGKDVPVHPSSKKDGTFDFWRGCRCPAIRYGKQVGFDPEKIDLSLFPSYALDPQKPWDDSRMDYSFNGLGCATTRTMGQGGERADLGYQPVWNMALLCNKTQEAWDVVRRAEDHIGGWGMVYVSDPETGGIVDVHKYPGTTTLAQAQVHAFKNNMLAPYGGSYDGDTLIVGKGGPQSWQTTKSPMIPNGAHLTAYAMLAAMITGTARDRDHASFWANWPLLEINPENTASGGVATGAQRRFAWCLRNLFMASYVSSDRQYFADETARNLPIAMKVATNEFGLYTSSTTYPRDPKESDGYRGMATWQQFYLMIVMDAVWHKLPKWKPLADYLAGFIVEWYKHPYSLVQTVYSIMVNNPDGSAMTDFGEMTRRGLIVAHWTEAQAEAVVSATTVEEAFKAVQAFYTKPDGTISWDGKLVGGVADYRGYLHSAESYPAMAGAATVGAAATGVAGTAEALAYWKALPTKPDFSADSKNNLKPRTV